MRSAQDAVDVVPADDARNACVGNGFPFSDQAAEVMSSLCLDDDMGMDAGDDTRAESDDERRP